jgi:hypothetical protein
MRNTMKGVVTLAAVAVLSTPMASANAGNSAAPLPKLDLTVSALDPATGQPTASAAWVGKPSTVGSNPVLQVTTGANPNENGAYSYFDGVVTNTPVNGEALSEVRNIGFDYKGDLGAGAPRISLGLSDGSYVYLAAGYSSKALGDGWYQFNTDDRCADQQADQLNGGPAKIWDSNGTVFTTGDNGLDAWVNMAFGHGLDTTITSIDLVQDENHGTVQFDNIRFDNMQFVQGGVKGATSVITALPCGG